MDVNTYLYKSNFPGHYIEVGSIHHVFMENIVPLKFVKRLNDEKWSVKYPI